MRLLIDTHALIWFCEGNVTSRFAASFAEKGFSHGAAPTERAPFDEVPPALPQFTVSTNPLSAVPPGLVAVRVTLLMAAVVGVPVMRPVVLL